MKYGIQFNRSTAGRFMQGFLANKVPAYKQQGLIGHTGVDYAKGYGTPVEAHNDGFVYKIAYSQNSPSNWQGVYVLTEYDDGKFMEQCYGHLSRVDVKVGDKITRGQIVGLEGNKGKVYQGQTEITPAMQRAGDKRGSHRHYSFRPVSLRPIKVPVGGLFYLENVNGSIYMTDAGCYQIINQNEGTKGHIDPLLFAVGTDTINLQQKVISLLTQLANLLKK